MNRTSNTNSTSEQRKRRKYVRETDLEQTTLPNKNIKTKIRQSKLKKVAENTNDAVYSGLHI